MEYSKTKIFKCKTTHEENGKSREKNRFEATF